MKAILIVFGALVASVCCNWCSYTATDGTFYSFYDLNLNGTSADGTAWFFDICANGNNELDAEDPCNALGQNVAVCTKSGDTYVSKGSADTFIWSDSPLGTDKGAEVMFNTESCKTVIELVCSDNYEPIVTINSESDAFTTITVNGSCACPEQLIGATDAPIYTGVYHHSERFYSFPIFVLPVALLAACFCMCCACVRRRRCEQRRATAMAHISNQAFQPIAHERQVPLNYPVPQSQFVYYYPMNNMTPQGQPAVVPLEVQKSDEDFAKELQAQYDRESRV